MATVRANPTAYFAAALRASDLQARRIHAHLRSSSPLPTPVATVRALGTCHIFARRSGPQSKCLYVRRHRITINKQAFAMQSIVKGLYISLPTLRLAEMQQHRAIGVHSFPQNTLRSLRGSVCLSCSARKGLQRLYTEHTCHNQRNTFYVIY